MKSKPKSCLPGAGVLLAVCLAAGALERVSIRSLASGAFSGITEARQEVIKSQVSWDKFLAAHQANTRSGPKLPAVDFSKEMVIAVTMGRKNSGGYAIEITGVETTRDALKVFVKRTSPAPGAITIAALTAPFHCVAAPKSDLRVEFVDTPAPEKAR